MSIIDCLADRSDVVKSFRADDAAVSANESSGAGRWFVQEMRLLAMSAGCQPGDGRAWRYALNLQLTKGAIDCKRL